LLQLNSINNSNGTVLQQLLTAIDDANVFYFVFFLVFFLFYLKKTYFLCLFYLLINAI